MESWELVSLEFDKHAKEIGNYFENVFEMPIRRVRRKSQREHKKYYKKRKICELVDRVLGKDSKRKLVLYGTGHYHHYTYGLCKHADRISDDYIYIHFDHHSDTCEESYDRIDCAGFVTTILRDTHASAVLYIGSHGSLDGFVPYKPQLVMTESNLREEKGFEELESGLASLPKDVYLSFDLDVMPPFLIHTPFNQGRLSLEELMKCVSLIKGTKHIIGADVLGYAGNVGKELYAKVVASLIDTNE